MISTSLLAKLASLGALAVSAAVLAFFAFFVWLTLPTGGIDRIEAHVSWLAVGVPLLLIIATHLYYARVLAGVARGEEFGV